MPKCLNDQMPKSLAQKQSTHKPIPPLQCWEGRETPLHPAILLHPAVPRTNIVLYILMGVLVCFFVFNQLLLEKCYGITFRNTFWKCCVFFRIRIFNQGFVARLITESDSVTTPWHSVMVCFPHASVKTNEFQGDLVATNKAYERHLQKSLATSHAF